MKKLIIIGIILFITACGNETLEISPEVIVINEFIQTCLISEDRTAKEVFMPTYADADVSLLLTMSCLGFNDDRFTNAEVTKTKVYNFEDGAKGNIHLLQGKETDMIILFKEGKMLWMYEPHKDGYSEMIKEF
jgi:hypothetical protein